MPASRPAAVFPDHAARWKGFRDARRPRTAGTDPPQPARPLPARLLLRDGLCLHLDRHLAVDARGHRRRAAPRRGPRRRNGSAAGRGHLRGAHPRRDPRDRSHRRPGRRAQAARQARAVAGRRALVPVRAPRRTADHAARFPGLRDVPTGPGGARRTRLRPALRARVRPDHAAGRTAARGDRLARLRAPPPATQVRPPGRRVRARCPVGAVAPAPVPRPDLGRVLRWRWRLRYRPVRPGRSGFQRRPQLGVQQHAREPARRGAAAHLHRRVLRHHGNRLPDRRHQLRDTLRSAP